MLRHFIKAGRCSPVNPLCKGYDSLSGNCTTCYPGYSVSNGLCVVSADEDKFPNCKSVENETCKECYNRYYLSETGCKEVNPLCKGYDLNTGACTSCYPGYKISGSQCVLPDPEEIDGNCKEFSISNPEVCVLCYQGYSVINGKCTIRDDLCAEYSQADSRCTACYSGYTLNQNNRCVITDSTQTVGISDANCIKLLNNDCIQCADGFFLNTQKKCELANPQCRTIDSLGRCLTCYPGFILTNGDCLSPLLSPEVSVPFCEEYGLNG